MNFDKSKHGHEYMTVRYTFMGQWTFFWSYFQVFYLIIVMMGLTITTLYYIFNKIILD